MNTRDPQGRKEASYGFSSQGLGPGIGPLDQFKR